MHRLTRPLLLRSRFAGPALMIRMLTLAILLGAFTDTWAAQFSPSSLSFSATQGGANPAAQTVRYSIDGGKRRNWSARASVPWVSVSPSSGSISTDTAALTVGVNISGLAAGTHSTTLTVTLNGDPSQRTTILPITVVITAGSTTSAPVISLTPTALSFSGTAGGSNPASQSFTVSNTGTGTLSWTAGKNAAWLSLSPTSGTNTGSVTASVNISGLSAGTYNATISVSATGATTKTIPVSLTLGSATSSSVDSATLSWDANTEKSLAGYKLYMGTQSGVYGPPVTLGNVTSHQVTNLKLGSTYFFAITAYDTAGTESQYSNEVSKSVY